MTATSKTTTEIPVRFLTLDEVRQDARVQARVTVDSECEIGYAAMMKAGDQFPPIDIFDDGTVKWLADGNYRLGACRRAGINRILARVRAGTLRDAILFAAGANADHGAQRSIKDKRRAVEMLLGDSEWAGRSSRWIGVASRTSGPFVLKVRRKYGSVVGAAIDRVKGLDGKNHRAARHGKVFRSRLPSCRFNIVEAAPTFAPDIPSDHAILRVKLSAHEFRNLGANATRAGKLPEEIARDALFTLGLLDDAERSNAT